MLTVHTSLQTVSMLSTKFSKMFVKDNAGKEVRNKNGEQPAQIVPTSGFCHLHHIHGK